MIVKMLACLSKFKLAKEKFILCLVYYNANIQFQPSSSLIYQTLKCLMIFSICYDNDKFKYNFMKYLIKICYKDKHCNRHLLTFRPFKNFFVIAIGVSASNKSLPRTF